MAAGEACTGKTRPEESNKAKIAITTTVRNDFNFAFSSLFPAIKRYADPNLKLSGTFLYMPKNVKMQAII
jgi:hypothetical protein